MKEIKSVSKESVKKFLFGICKWKEEHEIVKQEHPNWSYCPLCGENLPMRLFINPIKPNIK